MSNDEAVKRGGFIALGVLLGGCAGLMTAADDASTDAGSLDATTNESSAATDGGIDVATDIHDFSECPDGAPTSCADIGKCPGKASCCNGQYCNGYCFPWDAGGAAVDVGDGVCACGAIAGGCVWPTVCVDDQWCVAPTWTDTSPSYIDEGKDCGLPDVDVNCFASIYTCCNHAVCPGGCAQAAPDAEPYCECAGFEGGCPPSTVCCNNYGTASCVPPKYCAAQFVPDYCYAYYDQ